MRSTSSCIVENVVRAPQKPVASKRRRNARRSWIAVTATPSTNAPARFTRNVAHGQASALWGSHPATAVRSTAPATPPRHTASSSRGSATAGVRGGVRHRGRGGFDGPPPGEHGPVLTILEGSTFCVFDTSGDIDDPVSGFFARDTRFLSLLRLTVDGRKARLLDGRRVENYSALMFLRNDVTEGLAADQLLVRRGRFVGAHLHEPVVLQNLARRALPVRLARALSAASTALL